MKQGKIIGFNAAKMAEQMMANAVAEQNRRLVEYAEQRVRQKHTNSLLGTKEQQQTPHGRHRKLA